MARTTYILGVVAIVVNGAAALLNLWMLWRGRGTTAMLSPTIGAAVATFACVIPWLMGRWIDATRAVLDEKARTWTARADFQAEMVKKLREASIDDFRVSVERDRDLQRH